MRLSVRRHAESLTPSVSKRRSRIASLSNIGKRNSSAIRRPSVVLPLAGNPDTTMKRLMLVTSYQSEPVNESGVPEQRAQRRLIEAQTGAIARAMARICNEEQAPLGVMSGHG
ncbi:hypothetical protein BH11PSE8_BH11PSE8_35050 [soil metagenome]